MSDAHSGRRDWEGFFWGGGRGRAGRVGFGLGGAGSQPGSCAGSPLESGGSSRSTMYRSPGSKHLETYSRSNGTWWTWKFHLTRALPAQLPGCPFGGGGKRIAGGRGRGCDWVGWGCFCPCKVFVFALLGKRQTITFKDLIACVCLFSHYVNVIQKIHDECSSQKLIIVQ